MESSGISILTVLGIIFVVLKLVGVIAWSWWLVLLPFYGGLLMVVCTLLLLGMVSKLVE